MTAVIIEHANGCAWCVPPWYNRDNYVALFDHEAAEVAVLRSLFSAANDKTFIDVGANTGFYAVQLASLFRRVVAFEPDMDNASVLSVNAALNGHVNLCVLPVAAWSRLAAVSIAITNPGVMAGSHAHWTTRETEDTPCTSEHDRRDQILGVPIDSVQTAQVVIIKIDVEGCGHHVLHGGRRTIDRDRPAVLMEIHNESERRSLEETLLPLGYRPRSITTSTERELWEPA